MSEKRSADNKLLRSRFHTLASAIHGKVTRHMYNMDYVINMVLIALYCEGHVLLEGVPGLGKTDLVKTLGAVMGLDFGRIQFTPDLMPQDILGTRVPDPSAAGSIRLILGPGPIFTTLLLADEINRATAKTQSALLEAMAERQVTISGITRKMKPRKLVNTEPVNEPDSDKETPWPFMVLATQNPVDHEGTYTLPEAQSDRFMFKLLMPTPSVDAIGQILVKRAGKAARETIGKMNVVAIRESARETTTSIFNDSPFKEWGLDGVKSYADFSRLIQDVEPTRTLEILISNMFFVTNYQDGAEGLSSESERDLRDLLTPTRDDGSDTFQVLRYGLGPRAAIALMLAAKAWTVMFDTQESNPNGKADIRSLAYVAIPVLRHRIKLKYGWHEWFPQWKSEPEQVRVDLFIKELFLACLPTRLKGIPNTLDSKSITLLENILSGSAQNEIYTPPEHQK